MKLLIVLVLLSSCAASKKDYKAKYPAKTYMVKNRKY